MEYYDKIYFSDIHEYCKNHLTGDQTKIVLEKFNFERKELFP